MERRERVIINWNFGKYKVEGDGDVGGGQNLEQPNIERPVFRKFETSNNEITKVEFFDFLYFFKLRYFEKLLLFEIEQFQKFDVF